jgi:hypothetical protein
MGSDWVITGLDDNRTGGEVTDHPKPRLLSRSQPSVVSAYAAIFICDQLKDWPDPCWARGLPPFDVELVNGPVIKMP